MIGCGLAADFSQLLAARCLTGVGSALQNTGAQLFLADISTSENRAQCLGTNQVGCGDRGSALTTLLTKHLTAAMTRSCSWRKPFTSDNHAQCLGTNRARRTPPCSVSC